MKETLVRDALIIVLIIIVCPVLIVTIVMALAGNQPPLKPKFDQRIYDECVLESTNVTNDLDTYCKAYTRMYLRNDK